MVRYLKIQWLSVCRELFYILIYCRTCIDGAFSLHNKIVTSHNVDSSVWGWNMWCCIKQQIERLRSQKRIICFAYHVIRLTWKAKTRGKLSLSLWTLVETNVICFLNHRLRLIRQYYYVTRRGFKVEDLKKQKRTKLSAASLLMFRLLSAALLSRQHSL